MKSTASLLFGTLLGAAVNAVPVVDESYPYTGPAVPVGDWVDPTVNGNGKGFPRLVEAPAVTPKTDSPTNNINVISMAYIPEGITIHYQTPFGLGVAPSVNWGGSESSLRSIATGYSHTYDRTPPCSMAAVTQCSQHFHEVKIGNLTAGTTYFYQIPAANGTTASEVMSFTTAQAAGDSKQFSAVLLNDMGYANAAGTRKQIQKAVDEDGIAFAWHGGDISYADDWFSGILPCVDASLWPVCYNGSASRIPGNYAEDMLEYDTPLPEGEIPNWGGPMGGDMSVIYESNWDLWQQWMQNITSKVPYMVVPGNHEASCTEFDGPGNLLTAYLNNDTSNSTTGGTTNYGADLTYYSCPPSQRNFTAYQNRFHMAGEENGGGVGNFWYSFDYGLAHFVSIDTETDFVDSSEKPFAKDLKGDETKPTSKETYVTDSGPFGSVGNYSDTKTYQQYQWLAEDLAKVDRCKTPWIIAMSHRPMYSTNTASFMTGVRAAFEELLIEHEVDAYLSGHIHWYERMWPMTANGTIDSSSIVNNNTYYSNPGVSMTHIVNGMAGNGESHIVLAANQTIGEHTAVVDDQHYGFNKLTVVNSTTITFTFVQGSDGVENDQLTIIKRSSTNNGTCGTKSGTASSSTPTSFTGTGIHVTGTSLAQLIGIFAIALYLC